MRNTIIIISIFIATCISGVMSWIVHSWILFGFYLSSDLPIVLAFSLVIGIPIIFVTYYPAVKLLGIFLSGAIKWTTQVVASLSIGFALATISVGSKYGYTNGLYYLVEVGWNIYLYFLITSTVFVSSWILGDRFIANES